MYFAVIIFPIGMFVFRKLALAKFTHIYFCSIVDQDLTTNLDPSTSDGDSFR